MTVGVRYVNDEGAFVGSVSLIGCRGRSTPAVAPSPGWSHVVTRTHYLLIFLDAVAVDHPQLRIRLDKLESLRLELLVDPIDDALVPQSLRGMRARLPGVGVKLGKVRASVPIDIYFLRDCGRGQQQRHGQNCENTGLHLTISPCGTIRSTQSAPGKDLPSLAEIVPLAPLPARAPVLRDSATAGLRWRATFMAWRLALAAISCLL